MTDEDKIELLNRVKPISYTDGVEVFKKFMDEYIVHEKGLFILAPSGAGKTHYVRNQTEKNWIDGDDLWMDTGAQPPPETKWWTKGKEKIFEIDQRSDVVTAYAKKLGLWIIGASQYWIRPDAIVLPEWEKHKELITHREQNNYDGGAKSEDFTQVLEHRSWMEDLAAKENVPIFQSIEEAVEDLTRSSW